jgi:hypothetical protein
MPPYRVIDESELRKPFEEIALIGVPWEQFAARFDIHFTENDGRYEAPGPMGYALIELPSSRQFPLEHHFDYPEPGVWLFGRLDEDLDEQRAQVAEALGLAPEEFRWVRRGDEWFDAVTGGRAPS